MTSEEEIKKLCLSFNNTYKDYPFGKAQDHCVIRHIANKKIFALIFNKEGNTWVNLKCDPMFGDLLKQTHEAIVPAYHMNKEHWISVILNGSIPYEKIEQFVSDSYDLTKPKIKTKRIKRNP